MLKKCFNTFFNVFRVQVLNRAVNPNWYFERAQAVSPPAALKLPPFLPQDLIMSGTRKDCIRLRGLPYEALVEHILEFLGEHSKNIIYQGVHMVYNVQVKYPHTTKTFFSY